MDLHQIQILKILNQAHKKTNHNLDGWLTINQMFGDEGLFD